MYTMLYTHYVHETKTIVYTHYVHETLVYIECTYMDDPAHLDRRLHRRHGSFSSSHIYNSLYRRDCSFSTFSHMDDSAHPHRRLHRRHGSFSSFYIDNTLIDDTTQLRLSPVWTTPPIYIDVYTDKTAYFRVSI